MILHNLHLHVILNQVSDTSCHLNIKFAYTGHEIAPNTGANATKFFHFGDQILKVSRQIGD